MHQIITIILKRVVPVIFFSEMQTIPVIFYSKEDQTFKVKVWVFFNEQLILNYDVLGFQRINKIKAVSIVKKIEKKNNNHFNS